jgi:hypothetical protein
MRTVVIFILVFAAARIYGQEIKFVSDENKAKAKVEDSKKVLTRSMEAINSLRSIEYIWEDRSSLPYLPTVFNTPFVSKALVSFNKSDTVQGAAYELYLLEDTFKLKTIYDGRYILSEDRDSGRKYISDLSKSPGRAYGLNGSLHLRIRSLFESAISRNADMTVLTSNDTLKIQIVFNDLQIEFAPMGTRIERDTVGFISRYTIYLDRYSYVPTKLIREMPYQTSVETILYQRPNFTETLKISISDSTNANAIMENHDVVTDELTANQFKEMRLNDWKFIGIHGDSIQYSNIVGKKCLLIFNSIGWRPCELAMIFLKQFRKEYSNDELEVISVEPFINYVEVLKNYSDSHEINYPWVYADASTRKRYTILQVPIFLMIDRNGVVRKVVTGFSGKRTEEEIRNAASELE